MKWALVDKENIVRNFIVYERGANYTPPDGLDLFQVNDWLNIGDYTDKGVPPEVPRDPAKEKQKRNKEKVKDLSLVGCYEIEKKANPSLSFSDYIDALEQKSDDMAKQ